MTLSVADCCRFDSRLSREDSAWLGRLSQAIVHGDIVIRLEDGREDEPIIACDPDGTWRAGRYVGSMTFEGRRLDIRPRFGESTLRAWFAGAFNLAMVETPGKAAESDWFVPWLLATVWARAFAAAARHGLPALRSDELVHGTSIRGRLDVANTVRMKAAGVPGAASIRRGKSLDHAITVAIVAAHAELARWIGPRRFTEWLPEHIADLMPQLVAAVRPRPRLPTTVELDRVRLTPITAGFRPLSELSLRIARRQGMRGNSLSTGTCTGVMLDVAELWELYVLAATRRAWSGCEVSHGTHDGRSLALLSNDRGDTVGMLKPDAVIARRGRTIAIVDAKYKRLRPSAWAPAPQREDLYQMTAYLGRYSDERGPILGMLAYPSDPEDAATPQVEAGNPWRLESDKDVMFMTLPHELEAAAQKIRMAVS